MKRNIFILVLLATFLSNCQDVTVGYLDTRNAVYTPDSMVVKAKLDLDDFEDANRAEFKIPYQSIGIDGVQGTAPICYTITSVGDASLEISKQFSIQGAGIIILPYNHTVPTGRYVISILLENEGYKTELDSVYTVIVR